MPIPRPRAILVAAAAMLSAATAAPGTWSILVADTRTGEVVLATATCLTNFDMLTSTPVMLTGVGACTAQSFVEATGINRATVRDGLLRGTAPTSIINSLRLTDSGHQSRQYGIVSTRGTTATFSGLTNGPFAGGRTGQIGDFVYAVQGNVITGPCVLDSIVGSLQNTPGSLGDKVIAGMEAARIVGGDGRCSCSPDIADGCGCPPPASPNVKSAHIGVMIIARAGDQDRCNGIYRVGTSPAAPLVADINLDGRPDVVCANAGSSNLSVFSNVTPAGALLPVLAGSPTMATGPSPRAIIFADFTGDGLADLLVAHSGAATVNLYRATGVGTFAPAQSVIIPATSQAMVAGQFDDGPLVDAAVSNQANNTVYILRNIGGGVGLTASIGANMGTGASILGLAAADLGGSPATDIAVATSGRAAVGLLTGNGDGTFTRQADIPITGRPQSLVARDMDDDGLIDLVVATSNPARVNVLFQTASGVFEQTGNALVGTARIAVGDVNGDGLPDIIAVTGTSLIVLHNTGSRSFTAAQAAVLPTAASDVAAADLDSDGRVDLAITSSGLGNTLLTFKNYGGFFDTAAGCANGEYFFRHNVANQQAANPDPVFQLAQAYNTFKATRLGQPDAIVSSAVLDRGCLRSGGAAAVLTIQALDHTGGQAMVPAGGVGIRHAPGSGGLSTAGNVSVLADGRIAVEIIAAQGTGEDIFEVVLAVSARPVILMPALRLRISASTDVDGDGMITPDDMADFITCFFTPGCPGADINGDGVRDPDDLSEFINGFFLPCS